MVKVNWRGVPELLSSTHTHSWLRLICSHRPLKCILAPVPFNIEISRVIHDGRKLNFTITMKAIFSSVPLSCSSWSVPLAMRYGTNDTVIFIIINIPWYFFLVPFAQKTFYFLVPVVLLGINWVFSFPSFMSEQMLPSPCWLFTRHQASAQASQCCRWGRTYGGYSRCQIINMLFFLWGTSETGFSIGERGRGGEKKILISWGINFLLSL